MQKTTRLQRLLAVIVAVFMAVCCLPLNAFATGNTVQVDTVQMNIQFKDGDEVVAGGDYDVPTGVQNYSILKQYVPEGYQMTATGDFYAEADGKLVVSI